MASLFTKKHKLIAVGGTFDNIHIGHRLILETAFKLGEKVIIGLTSDKFIANKKLSKKIPPYSKRKENLEKFILTLDVKPEFEIIKIDDKYGPSIHIPEIDAIVVSNETLQTAKEINLIRTENNLPQLEIYVVNTVLAEDGQPVSSTRIRKGEINREGKSLKTKE
ncbi:MAG: phosphopantetheine adenylyltransferase [Candidatus Odinarchaeia archaeon]